MYVQFTAPFGGKITAETHYQPAQIAEFDDLIGWELIDRNVAQEATAEQVAQAAQVEPPPPPPAPPPVVEAPVNVPEPPSIFDSMIAYNKAERERRERIHIAPELIEQLAAVLQKREKTIEELIAGLEANANHDTR